MAAKTKAKPQKQNRQRKTNEAQKPAPQKAKPKQPVKAKAKPKPKQPAKTKTSAKAKASEKLANSGDIVPAIQDVEVDFCGIELTPLQYSFLLYYLTPGQPCFHNAYQAALKAGYSENSAKVKPYGLLRDSTIQKIVAANDKLTQLSLHEAAKLAIEIKKQRAFYDPLDYFEEREIEMQTKDGETYTKKGVGLKPLENMTPQQRVCIDGMDLKGQGNTPVYVMPDREKNLNDIIKMDADMSKSIGDGGEEETREIIIERITIKETRRAQYPADMYDDIVEGPENV
jgi:phage terminase small subunit